MSHVKRSPKQKAQLERMEWANQFYHSVMGDPVLQARYARRAKARKTTIHRLATREYMARSKQLGRVNVYSEALAAARESQKNR